MLPALDEKPHLFPPFIYGTAWKEDATEELTRLALTEGFRGIDTANQRRHYVEVAVGRALSTCLQRGKIQRDELFIQTKYTYAAGQDHRIPFDIRADYPTQVRQSFQSSLQHLQTEYIDSYVLHGPSVRSGLTEDDWQVWRTMEEIHSEGKVKFLGVSNFNLEQLVLLVQGASVKPTFVQNRCFSQLKWDAQIRHFCKQHGSIYQGFSLLTANKFVLANQEVIGIADRIGKTPAQVIFRFAIQMGMLPLTGTTNSIHMRKGLECLNFTLPDEDIHFIESISI